MLSRLHRTQIFEILPISVLTVRLSDLVRQRYWRIASLYQKFIVFTEQKFA